MATAENLLVNKILNLAAERRATDIHLTAGSYPVLRIDGKLITLTSEQVLTPDFISGMAESFLSAADQKRLEQERDVVTVYDWASRARFRAKVFYQKGFLAISLRLIPQIIPSIKDLGLPPIVQELAGKDKGLLIITGPFGSGRTTTVTSIIETLNHSRGVHIQTLEKPIEYLLANNQAVIEQREIGKDSSSFVKGLEEMLEADVDVAVVHGLMEEGQEELILQLAEAGKLVILIMDAISVISALERFISNLDPNRRDWGQDTLSQVLVGVVSQRLLPRIAGGQILAYEVLTMTPAVRSTIQSDRLPQLNNIMQTSKDEGMINMDKTLQNLVNLGEINPADAKEQMIDSSTLERSY